MKVFITGGGGLIGQAVAKRHIAEGDEVFIYDTKVNPFNDYRNLVGQDVTQSYEGDLEKTLIYLKPDIISHHAALVGVGQSQHDIARYVDNNIGFTGLLLQIIADNSLKPQKLLLAGSMGPYGDLYAPWAIAHEYTILDPQSIYAVTKLAQETLVKVFANTYEIPSISLRYFSVYGTEQNPLNPFTGVLSIIANQCLNSETIEIYDDGRQTRDLIHIDDVAEAHFLASRYEIPTDYFKKFNIGTGKSTTLALAAMLIRDKLSPNKKVVFTGKKRKGDIKHMKADARLASALLNFKAKKDIYTGINEYCDYVEAHRKEFTVGNTVKEDTEFMEMLGLVK